MNMTTFKNALLQKLKTRKKQRHCCGLMKILSKVSWRVNQSFMTSTTDKSCGNGAEEGHKNSDDNDLILDAAQKAAERAAEAANDSTTAIKNALEALNQFVKKLDEFFAKNGIPIQEKTTYRVPRSVRINYSYMPTSPKNLPFMRRRFYSKKGR